MVPEAGLEPARYFYRGILSPLRLPIPPPGLWYRFSFSFSTVLQKFYMEAEPGIEPRSTALQAAA